MKTLILGDVHGRWAQADALYEDIVEHNGEPELLIQVGDFGFWPREPRIGVWEREFSHPCLWIDGNHEDFQTLKNIGEPDWGFTNYSKPIGLDKWYKVMESWTYMPRSSFLDGVLFIGGARSIDQLQRQRGWDWFPEENISYFNQQQVFDTIEAVGAENIHTIISHDCPGRFNVSKACTYTGVETIDGNRKFLQAILEQVRPQRWFFGHYHLKMSGVDISTGCQWRCIDMVRPPHKNRDFVILDLPFNPESFNS